MKLLLPIVILIVLLGAYLLTNQIKNQQKNPPLTTLSTPSPITQDLRTFESKTMKFSIESPLEFLVEEKLGKTTVTSGQGKITIDKNGTNFENLEDYLEDLSGKNKRELKNQTKTKINDLETVVGFIEDNKNYYIYAANSVFLLSTGNQPLYDELDQIAQSFRYIP